MAIGIENFDNIDTTDPTNYPNGQIKDDTGIGDGTPANAETNGDIFQFFDKLLRLAGITASGDPENETNGYQLIQALADFNTLAVDGGEWLDAGTPAITTLVGSVTVGTVHYNKYKVFGKTLIWELSADITTGSSPTDLLLDYPALLDANYDVVNLTHKQLGEFGGVAMVCAISGGIGGAGSRQVGLTLSGGGAFGNNTVNMTLITELIKL